MKTILDAKFSLGRIVATPGALRKMAEAQEDIFAFTSPATPVGIGAKLQARPE